MELIGVTVELTGAAVAGTGGELVEFTFGEEFPRVGTADAATEGEGVERAASEELLCEFLEPTTPPTTAAMRIETAIAETMIHFFLLDVLFGVPLFSIAVRLSWAEKVRLK